MQVTRLSMFTFFVLGTLVGQSTWAMDEDYCKKLLENARTTPGFPSPSRVRVAGRGLDVPTGELAIHIAQDRLAEARAGLAELGIELSDDALIADANGVLAYVVTPGTQITAEQVAAVSGVITVHSPQERSR